MWQKRPEMMKNSGMRKLCSHSAIAEEEISAVGELDRPHPPQDLPAWLAWK